MKFEVRQITDGERGRDRLIATHTAFVTVGEGVYRFYKTHPSEPIALYPIRSYYVKRIEG